MKEIYHKLMKIHNASKMCYYYNEQDPILVSKPKREKKPQRRKDEPANYFFSTDHCFFNDFKLRPQPGRE